MLNERGHEVPDQTPVAVPLGWKRPETLQETVRRLIRGAMSDQASAVGQESFEEADDFEVGDDYDPRSPFEIDEQAGGVPDWELQARHAGWKPKARGWQEEALASGWEPPAPPPKPAVEAAKPVPPSAGG